MRLPSRDQDGTLAPPGMATSRHGRPPAALMSQISLLPDAWDSKAISRLSRDHAGWNGSSDCAASSRNPVPSEFPVHRFQWPERFETNAIDFPSVENAGSISSRMEANSLCGG